MSSRFLEENSRSNERLIGQLLEGLQAILPHSAQAAPHAQRQTPSQHPHHPYPQHQFPQHQYPQYQHTYPQQKPYPQPQQPQPVDSDYTVQDLD